MIVFKRGEFPDIEREFSQIDQRLARVVNVLETLAWAMYRDILVVTCIKRTHSLRQGDTHFEQRRPYRFIDFAMLENADNEALRKVINILFPYGKDGLLTVPEFDHGGTALHWHIQVRP